ncbi:hypothetical protein C7974DRAFT_214334 [Boeremia exigua]|uniref:uncharacterized protein n=1 Tax=Boeremia exigua TaxID=749465 RepID=UPI001E8D8ABF|nr:uncharacterized protein C7974DRAFT_214334 [Boeremia exigua]KAH6621989.1 hypothetical protein C7974DRAFT_214334 [Boeremia exigua]
MPGGIHAPIEEILKWPLPNTVNPEYRPNTVFLVACICGPLTFVMLMARLWVRIFHQRNPGWDDWLVTAGTIPTIAATFVIPLAVESGFRQHIWDIGVFKNPEKVVIARKYVLSILCVFCVASGLVKISILLFFRRLSSRVVSNGFRYATWITIGFIASSSIAFTLVPIFGCRPISAFWDQTNSTKILNGYKYHCFNEGADVFAASIISMVQDFFTALLPTFLYWKLRIPVRQKMALFGIFAIGYGVGALGAIRAYYSWQIYFATYDVTWVTWELFLVTLLELHVGCFCANAPSLKVFFRHFFHDKLTSSAKQSEDSAQKKQASKTQSTKPSILVETVSSLFSKSSGMHSTKGYLSESHAEISVDEHGGVQVQRDVHIDHSPAPHAVIEPTRHELRPSADTTDMIRASYYDDIEMGHFTTGRNSQASRMYSPGLPADTDIEALPTMPEALKSPRSLKSFLSLYRYSRSPRTSAHPEWPHWSFRATITEERQGADSRSQLYPTRSDSLQKAKGEIET